jgi:predicted DCC family thiol-disulfide oxidoreductase YuxK
LLDRLPHGESIAPWQAITDLSVYLLTSEEANERLHWISSDGKKYAGHGAIAEALKTSSFPWNLIGRAMLFPGISFVMAKVYVLIARNRHRLPGSTSSCEIKKAA